MKKLFIAASLFISLIGGSFMAQAVPAMPGLRTVTNSDGSQLEVRLVGDEFSHYYLSEDGYLLVERNGDFHYGNIVDGAIADSGIKATAKTARTALARNYLASIDKNVLGAALDARTEMAPRRLKQRVNNVFRAPRNAASADEGYPAGPGLFEGTSFPSKGDQKALVILVQYKDKAFQLADPLDYFSRMLNEDGFNDYGGTGCAAEYFRLCSGGLFRPEFDVVGPITLSQKMSYYGGNDWMGNDLHPEEMVIEACQQLDDEIDFSQYDRDGDGYIDNIFLFYAGQGEASYGGDNTVWPHSWEITSATYTPYYFDGVRLDRYGCTNEWESSRPDGVGTFIHEFSHVMGLPDLYSTSYTGAFTPGAWSALDYGPYNNDGMTPPLYGAFERYALGWTAPEVIDGPLNATLPPVLDNTFGIIKTTSNNEFFLLENRQQESWDTYIPGHGMLIWHIDYKASVWSSNAVNNTWSHQYVDIEEADNTTSEYSRDGDAFPGSKNITSFTDNTTPGMKTWAGKSLELPITEIAESADGLITFKVCDGRDPLAAAVALEPVTVADESFEAKWETVDGMSYILNVYTRDEAGNIGYIDGYKSLRVGATDHYEVTGLTADATYYYTVTAYQSLEWAPVSNEIKVSTGGPSLKSQIVESTGAVNVTNAGFTATWLPLDGANDYILSVFTKDTEAAIDDTYGFDLGGKTLPEGWTSSSASSYANEAYSGENIPSLRLGKSGDTLSATYADYITGLKFWHRGNGTSADDVINVYLTSKDGRSLFASVPVKADAGGIVTTLTDFPEGSTTVTLEYVRTGSKGSVAIDDVTVSHGQTFATKAVEGYDGIHTGDVTSYEVIGLLPSRQYYYTVTATDGELLSKPSVETLVMTGDVNSSIAEATATSAVSLDGRRLAVAAPGEILVVDIAGRTVAVSRDRLTTTLPATGIYVVRTADRVVKLIAK